MSFEQLQPNDVGLDPPPKPPPPIPLLSPPPVPWAPAVAAGRHVTGERAVADDDRATRVVVDSAAAAQVAVATVEARGTGAAISALSGVARDRIVAQRGVGCAGVEDEDAGPHAAAARATAPAEPAPPAPPRVSLPPIVVLVMVSWPVASEKMPPP